MISSLNMLPAALFFTLAPFDQIHISVSRSLSRRSDIKQVPCSLSSSGHTAISLTQLARHYQKEHLDEPVRYIG